MSRGPRQNPTPGWREDWSDSSDWAHPPQADHDTDKRIVGHILNAKGKKLHTVKKKGSVEFGFRRSDR